MLQYAQIFLAIFGTALTIYIAIKERLLRLEIETKAIRTEIASIYLRLKEGADTMNSLEKHIVELNLSIVKLNSTIDYINKTLK